MAELEASIPTPWQEWSDLIRSAASDGSRIRIRGSGTKDFLGDASRARSVLTTTSWRGVENHEPTELVIRARAGTPLAEVEALLASKGQYLAFEPPRYGWTSYDGPTLGGVVAAGLSGPGRVSRGALRDHVLGCTMMNGKGEVLRFGGSVMKNVAGFDLSRLMAGSMGTLGVILDVTLKVMPQPMSTATLRIEMTEADALMQVNQWAAQPLPLDASAWWDGMLVLRLRGARSAVASAAQRLYKERGGELIAPPLAEGFWQGLRDHSDEFFVRARAAVASGGAHGVTLWRIAVPPTAAPLAFPGEQLIEWFGAQRWVCTALPAAKLHDVVARAGGHAQPFVSKRAHALVDEAGMSPVLRRLHERVQRAFDPHGVFLTGRKWSGAQTELEALERDPSDTASADNGAAMPLSSL